MSFPEKKFKEWLYKRWTDEFGGYSGEDMTDAARWGYGLKDEEQDAIRIKAFNEGSKRGNEKAVEWFKRLLAEQRKEANRILDHNSGYANPRLDLLKVLEERLK